MRLLVKKIYKRYVEVNETEIVYEIITDVTIMSSEIEFWEDFPEDDYINRSEKTILGLKSCSEIIIICSYDKFCEIMEKVFFDKMNTLNKIKCN